MKTIWKYKLIPRSTYIEIPKGAKFLHLDIQNQDICLWFQVDPENEIEIRSFEIIGTGWEFKDDNLNYIGTINNGLYIWHIYEKINNK